MIWSHVSNVHVRSYSKQGERMWFVRCSYIRLGGDNVEYAHIWRSGYPSTPLLVVCKKDRANISDLIWNMDGNETELHTIERRRLKPQTL